jgi:ABC-type maltose transport system permease subunit
MVPVALQSVPPICTKSSIVVLIVQRYIVKGLTLGTVKG